jgi:carboxyl-terminal processing protease
LVESIKIKLCTILLVILIILCTGCENGKTEVEFDLPEIEDFSELGWVEAFESMHKKISIEYAFTELKDVDWDQKLEEYRPLIEKAWEANDKRAYYILLRSYLFSIPDGHVALITGRSYNDDDMGTLWQEVGGGFGMTVALLDDGRLVADWVEEEGPAGLAGIEAGAEIIEWDGKSAAIALRETSTIWSVLPQATDIGRDYERTRFMVRASVGEARMVMFQNPGGALLTATLAAVDDEMETLKKTDVYGSGFTGGPVDKFIESRQLEDGTGYIKIYGEANKPDQHPTLDQFTEMIEDFEASNVQGLIIDLRGNMGGADIMAAAFLGSFYDTKTFYEYMSWYNQTTGKMEIVLFDEETGEVKRDVGLYIEPALARFTGRVVALTNPGCISSGEGIAMGIKNLDRGEVVGFRGTNGSFGMVMGPVIEMPGGYLIMYPVGQSLDKDKRIQLDSNGRKGGVIPTIRVPMTLENALRSAAGVDVELEYALELLKGKQ